LAFYNVLGLRYDKRWRLFGFLHKMESGYMVNKVEIIRMEHTNDPKKLQMAMVNTHKYGTLLTLSLFYTRQLIKYTKTQDTRHKVAIATAMANKIRIMK